MSKDFPMVSLDKVEVKLTMKTYTIVMVDKIANGAGISRAALINSYVEDGLKRANVALTSEDLERVDEIRKANIAKREAMKAKKGVK